MASAVEFAPSGEAVVQQPVPLRKDTSIIFAFEGARCEALSTLRLVGNFFEEHPEVLNDSHFGIKHLHEKNLTELGVLVRKLFGQLLMYEAGKDVIGSYSNVLKTLDENPTDEHRGNYRIPASLYEKLHLLKYCIKANVSEPKVPEFVWDDQRILDLVDATNIQILGYLKNIHEAELPR